MTNKKFPSPLPLKKLIGPSFIILALGLGSGEVILWPYLVSNWGLGIAWGAILGITFQFFINMEIERYALIKGESVFVGFTKLCKYLTFWFILSTFVGFGLPGIIAASAKVFGVVIGIEAFRWIAIAFLILIGVILSSGKTVYTMMEKITRTIILIGVPFIFILTIILASKTDWTTLGKGIFGFGEGFYGLPEGIVIATFLAAFAYAGAGGNLNLTQSIYIKEKGYGMGKYSQKIAGLFKGSKNQKVKLSGENFELNENNLKKAGIWWKIINIEHLLVFWLIGAFTMIMLMLLAYTTTFGTPGNAEGINFVINEGFVIGKAFFPAVGMAFLFVVSIMLFQTQLGIMDSTSRIMAENLAAFKLSKKTSQTINLSKIYFIFLWAQITFGIILFLFNISEPKMLIVLGAVINAFSMFIYTGLMLFLNHKQLPKPLRPSWIRKIILLFIFLFFGFFSVMVLLDKINI